MSQQVPVTHPDKVLFPGDGITKAELVDYYALVAPAMIAHLRNRPVTMERYPAGIDAKGFFQKDLSKGFPGWLPRIEVPKKAGSLHHPLFNEARALRWMANQNCITPHVWSSRVPRLDRPDLLIFDLDPANPDERARLRTAALGLRELLVELGLTSWLKTSGSKGFHIAVPLDGNTAMGQVATFAHRVGAQMVRRQPAHLTQEFSKADRGGRILMDTGRNGFGATFAAAYAVRPKPHAPVSAPCSWEELADGSVQPRSFDLRNMPQRMAEVGDLWKEMRASPQSLAQPQARLAALEG